MPARQKIRVAEILKSINYVTDPKEKISVSLVDPGVLEQIVMMLDDSEDSDEIKLAGPVKEKKISWIMAKKELKLEIQGRK